MRNRELYQKILLAREKKNENLKHASLEKETSTHFPILMKVVNRYFSRDPILEVGSGLFSTPLLHWMCFEEKRPLVTFETHEHYADFARKFSADFHEIRVARNLKDVLKGEEHFGIAFIDHTPKKPRTRGDDALMLKQRADIIVMHDAGVDAKEKYGYQQLWPHFRHVYHWDKDNPHTTVLSNTVDLSFLHA